jgi:bis(5'-nucleosidyl)-tetraphosphatase
VKLRAAGVVLFRRDAAGEPRLLLLRHAGDGHWTPPKGKLEAGEDELGAALREVLEETGLAPRRLEPSFCEAVEYEVEKKGRRGRKTVVFFLAEAPPGPVRLSGEHDEARWATLDEARALVPWENLRAVLTRAVHRIGAAAS